MHKRKLTAQPRLWLLDHVPAGSDVWVNKTNYMVVPIGYQSLQLPSGMTLRVVTHEGGYVRINDKQWTLSRGDVFCATPGVEICFGCTDHGQWGWYEIQLRGTGARRVFGACGMTPRLPKVVPHDKTTVLKQFQAMHGLFDRSDRQPHQAMAILHRIIDAIGHAIMPEISSQNARGHMVDLACAMLESQPNIGMNVNELANLLGVDRVTLQRAFKSQLGMSPSDYISSQRIKRAYELLDATDWPLKQVAVACGYVSEKYFIRAFRLATNKTPGKWRKDGKTL